MVSNSYDAFLALSLPLPQISLEELDVYYTALQAK